MDLNWESVDAKQLTRRVGESIATVSDARLTLSPTACSLIDDVYNLPYVEIKIARNDKNSVEKIGVFLLSEKSENSLSVTRRKYNGGFAEGININSKSLINILFGELGDKTKKFHVEKGGDNLLIIDVNKEI